MVDGMATVMVVDDDPLWREALLDLLALEGIRGMGAANGAEALWSLRRGARPDLVVTDLSMPVMSGWQLLAELLRDPTLASIPVAVVSGEDEPRGLPLDRYFRKTCDPEELLATVRELTRARQVA
jgi:CheY-like chemotaxis protein